MLKIDETIVPLLKDFETYTRYLEENHIELTSKENWIPPKILYELNGKMSSYVTPRSTPRTPQKYYVLLNLMFYLATEGKLFDKVKKKGSLYLEPTDRLNAYRALTPTEKYFFLLETFWRDIDWRYLDIDNLYKEDPLVEIHFLFYLLFPDEDLKKELKRAGFKEWIYTSNDRINFVIFTFYLFRLFDLSINENMREDLFSFKYYIPINGIKLSPLGEKILAVMIKERDMFHWNIPWRRINYGEMNPIPGSPLPNEREGKEEITYTEELFFLPFVDLFEEGELTKTLPRIVERIEFVDGVYIFKVSLLPKKEVWRRIKVSSDHTLSDLAGAIIDAYRFDYEHLYSFFMDGEKWSPYSFTSPEEREGPHADRIKIGELNLRKRQKILFLYDYGREWSFEVELEGIEKDKPKPDRPKIIERHGRSPEQYPRWW
jgi:shikimate kinase